MVESHGSPASGNESPGSHHSETPVGSPVGSGSPAHSGSPPNSPGAESGSAASHRSGSPNRSQSGTPMGSPASHRCDTHIKCIFSFITATKIVKLTLV